MIWRNVIVIFALMSMIAGAFGDTIALRASVRLAPDSEHVRLGDIASIEGENAATLLNIVIAPAPRAGQTLEIQVNQVRSRLDEAGVHWGRTHLNGGKVVIRSGRGTTAAPPRAMEPVALDGAKEQPHKRQGPTAHAATTLLAGSDLRSMVAELLVRRLNIQPSQLQIAFDDRDRELLESEPGETRYEIEPVSSIASARVDLAVRIWQGDRIIDRKTVSVQPTVRVPVVVLRRDVDRGSTVSADDVTTQEQWIAPSTPDSAGFVRHANEIIGRTATSRLREGDVLRETHLQREIIVRRGEIVIVRCIVGGAVISLQAEARANATEGETIEFRKPGERETFLATVTGRNAAVVNLAQRAR